MSDETDWTELRHQFSQMNPEARLIIATVLNALSLVRNTWTSEELFAIAQIAREIG